jgi:hypothetical protein
MTALLKVSLRNLMNNPWNYSKLKQKGSNVFHCHLKWSYVAVWEYKNNEIVVKEITISYVGSRENAPY